MELIIFWDKLMNFNFDVTIWENLRYFPQPIYKIQDLFLRSFDGIHYLFRRSFLKICDIFFTIDWGNLRFFWRNLFDIIFWRNSLFFYAAYGRMIFYPVTDYWNLYFFSAIYWGKLIIVSEIFYEIDDILPHLFEEKFDNFFFPWMIHKLIL